MKTIYCMFFVVDVCSNIGKLWIKQLLIGAFLVPALVCGMAFFINFIAIYYHASRAIQFSIMVSTPRKILLLFDKTLEILHVTSLVDKQV